MRGGTGGPGRLYVSDGGYSAESSDHLDFGPDSEDSEFELEGDRPLVDSGHSAPPGGDLPTPPLAPRAGQKPPRSSSAASSPSRSQPSAASLSPNGGAEDIRERNAAAQRFLSVFHSTAGAKGGLEGIAAA